MERHSCRGSTHDWTEDWAAPRSEVPRTRCRRCGKFRCMARTYREHGKQCRRSALPDSDLCLVHQGIEEWAKIQQTVAKP